MLLAFVGFGFVLARSFGGLGRVGALAFVSSFSFASCLGSFSSLVVLGLVLVVGIPLGVLVLALALAFCCLGRGSGLAFWLGFGLGFSTFGWWARSSSGLGSFPLFGRSCLLSLN